MKPLDASSKAAEVLRLGLVEGISVRQMAPNALAICTQ